MRQRRILFLAAAALGAVACFQGGKGATPGRSTLERAVRLRQTDPARAARLAERARPSAALENYRLELWIRSLERSAAGPDAWRRLLRQPLPAALERHVLIGLGGSLLQVGQEEPAIEVLRRASAAGSRRADELLLSVSVESTRRWAARRLAVTAPARLHRADATLEAGIVRSLTPAERLLRAAAWRSAGAPRRAIRELGRWHWRGELEARRREELAHSWIAAGQPKRALRVLPGGTRLPPALLLVRAEGERRVGWSLFPRPASGRWFHRSLRSAESCLERSTGNVRRRALEIILETATETGRLEEAWRAWRKLAASGWQGRRRGWLGRRLGVAMARTHRWPERITELAAELPVHRACLEYWSAAGSISGRGILRRLAATEPGGLYAAWARSQLGVPGPRRVHLAPPVGAGEPPAPVALLLAWGDAEGARWQWRRYRKVRGALPAEAIAAATLEVAGPRPGEAIRWLRRSFPKLGGPDLEGCPSDAVQLYLPLRWSTALHRAAREAGIDPWLLAGVVRQESSFVAHARSSRGAVGLAQLIPTTARRHARALGLGRPDLEDPATNLRLAARELAHLLDRFGAVEPALAAYNAGETRTARWWKRWPEPHRFTEEIPVPETYNYVRRVVFLAQAYRAVWDEALTSSTPQR